MLFSSTTGRLRPIHRRLWVAAAPAALAWGVACATPRTWEEIPEPTPPVDEIGPGDVLELIVEDEPSLRRLVVVDAARSIEAPLCGAISVVGLGPADVAAAYRRCLDRDYVVEPEVRVLLKEQNSRTVVVTGDVRRPGRLPWTPGMTLLQAMTASDPPSGHVVVTLERSRHRYEVHLEDIAAGKRSDVPLVPGDRLQVHEEGGS